MPRLALLTALAAALLLVAACAAPPPDTDPAAAAGADLTVLMGDMFYEPDRIEVPAGTPVTVLLDNDGGIVHDLVLDDGWSSGEVLPGGTALVELPPLTGPTVGWCSVPGHRDAGMELTISVTGGG